MTKRYVYILMVVFGFLLAGGSTADADGTPDLKVSTWDGSWKESEVIRTRGTTREIYLRLKNKPDADGDTNSHTFTFTGPAGGDDWNLDYYHAGASKSNSFELELEEDETTTVRVEATPQSYPDSYLWAAESAGNAFSLTGNGSTDRADAVIVVPGDVSIRYRGEGAWVGENTILDPKVDIWGSAQQAPLNSAATDGAAVYHIALRNVNNATVSYRVKTQVKPESPASLQVCWTTDSGWQVQQDITSQVRSETGYPTGYLQPGGTAFFKLYVVPVGNEDAARPIAVTAAVDDIDGLDGLNELTDMVPVTACLESLPPSGDSFNLYGPPNEDTLTPGNFGLMDYDGGSNPVGELEEWMLSRADVSVPDDQDHVWIDGSPGYKSSLKEEFSAVVGQTLNVPVTTDMRSTGSQSEFKVKGYAQVKLTSFSNGNPATATFEWVSFFHMPMLTEAVICNTGRAEGLTMGPWQEIDPMQYEQN